MGGVDSRPSEILGVLYRHQATQEHYILGERRIDPSGVGEQRWRVCGGAQARESDREAVVPCSVQVIAVLFLDRCCRLIVCVLYLLNHSEQAMADCIWMETALIASSLAEHRDIACSWVWKQGAIERDLSNETTYQELVEELRLRLLGARATATLPCK